jgi:hypothetical protein
LVNAEARLRLRLESGRAAHPSWYLNAGLLLDTTMTNTEARGSKTTDSSDWSHAWSVVSQLAAARGTALRELGQDDRAAAPSAGIDASFGDTSFGGASLGDASLGDASPLDATLAPNAAAASGPPFAPVVPDQLARDLAEIEQAAAALRRAEPALEPRVHDQLARDIAEIEQAATALRRLEPALEPRAREMPPGIEPRVSHSVWPLICVVWLTAAMVMTCAVGAVVLLVG